MHNEGTPGILSMTLEFFPSDILQLLKQKLGSKYISISKWLKHYFILASKTHL